MQDVWGELRSAVALRDWSTAFELSKHDDDMYRYACDILCKQDEALTPVYKSGSCLEGVETWDVPYCDRYAPPIVFGGLLHGRFYYQTVAREMVNVQNMPEGARLSYTTDLEEEF